MGAPLLAGKTGSRPGSGQDFRRQPVAGRFLVPAAADCRGAFFGSTQYRATKDGKQPPTVDFRVSDSDTGAEARGETGKNF